MPSLNRKARVTIAIHLPIVSYRLIYSEVILELSGRIKAFDCQEMVFFFSNKNHERIIKTVGYWC